MRSFAVTEELQSSSTAGQKKIRSSAVNSERRLTPDSCLCRLLLQKTVTHGSLNTMQVCVSHAIACLCIV